GNRQTLQIVRDRDFAAAIDVRRRRGLHRRGRFDRALPDARASDDHLFRLLLSGEGGLYTCGRDQTRRGEQGVAILTGQGTKRSYIHNDLPREGADASTRYCKEARRGGRARPRINRFDAGIQRANDFLAQSWVQGSARLESVHSAHAATAARRGGTLAEARAS